MNIFNLLKNSNDHKLILIIIHSYFSIRLNKNNKQENI